MTGNPALAEELAVKYAGAAVGAGSSIDNDGSVIDTAGYEGCLFIAPLTDSVATGVATLTIEQGAAANLSDAAALEGASATATSAENDDLNNKYLIVDVYRPRERYLRGVRTSATANIAYGVMTAVLYGARKRPTSIADSDILARTAVNSPDEA